MISFAPRSNRAPAELEALSYANMACVPAAIAQSCAGPYFIGPCICGKLAAVANGELSAGREMAATLALAQPRWAAAGSAAAGPAAALADRTRVGILSAHLGALGSVPRTLVEPAAASAASMAEQLRELISIPSVNPDQVTRTGGDPMSDPDCGEHAIAARLAEKFEALGAEVILEDCNEGWFQRVDGFDPRSNIYVVIESDDPKAKWLGIDTHIDTVMVTGMAPYGAFDATVTPDGRIHGRGACDTKATWAIVRSPPQPNQSRRFFSLR